MLKEKPERETVSGLRQKLHQAAVDCAYWRGKAEALESVINQQSQPAQDPLKDLLLAKLKERQGDVPTA